MSYVGLTEIVEHDAIGIHAEAIEHLLNRLTHRAGSAHVILDVFGCVVIFQIGFIHHLVYESHGVRHTGFVGLGVGTIQREVEMEVGIFFFQRMEIIKEEASLRERAP